MNENEKNKAAISNFLEKYKKLQNLGVDEFVRQEIIFKNDASGLEIDNIRKMRRGLLFESDEQKKKIVLQLALEKVNLLLKKNHDIDVRSKILFLKYECLYDLSRFEESLISVIEAIQLYATYSNVYKPQLGLYYRMSIELFIQFNEFELALIYLDKAESLCVGDRIAIVNDLEGIITNRADVFFKMKRIKESLVEIDRAIYLFSDGDPHQYKTHFALRKRAFFKKELGDVEGANMDFKTADLWEDKINEKFFKK